MEKRVAAKRALGRMPLYFIENRSQVDSQVAFYVQGRDTTLYFTADGMTLVQTDPMHGENSAKSGLQKASLGRGSIQTPDAVNRWVVKLDFVGANPNPKITPGDRLPAVVSYFKGPKENWKAGLSTYGSIVYSDLWPGIDLVYSGTADRLKYSFLVKPEADPGQVRLAYRGASAIRVNGAGQLEIETPAGVLQDDRPYAYQEIEGRRVAIDVSYSLDRASEGAPQGYGFAVQPYDRTGPLVLDPAMLVYAGYIGGGNDDKGYAIAVDSSGNAYVTGRTASTETTLPVPFPVTVGPDLTYNGGTSDAFVAKVNAAGTGLVYCGYIGGSDDDVGFGIAVDSSGNAYVTGRTASTEATLPVPFPVTVGPDLTYNGGSVDAFVAKVNAAGTGLLYCGYIGGEDDDVGTGIAVDSSGNAYVTGFTASQVTFPVTVGPDLSYNGGLADAFVAKVNAAGTGLVYCGYIGGSAYDEGLGIAVDSSGNAYVTGDTESTEASPVPFPVTVGPDLSYNGGFADAFVAKVNASGTTLVYCGYIGGSSEEYGAGIAVDSSGNAYVTGATTSTAASFPVTVGPDLTHNGGHDAFVAKVNAAGTTLLYCGYIGGSGEDIGAGIAVDGSGNAYVTGQTNSTQDTFPVTGGPDLTYNGGTSDAFVAKVNRLGTGLAYCGYIGGGGSDQGFGIAVDSVGNAYVTGTTASDAATFPVTVGPDLTYNGGGDAFVAKISLGETASGALIPDGRANTSTLLAGASNIHRGAAVADRSYCVEVEVPFNGAGTLAEGGPLPDLSVTRADGVTAVGSEVTASCKPGVATRLSFTPSAADVSGGPLQFHVSDSASSSYPYRVRLTDTTMFCARWSVNSYTALINLQNTTDCAVAGQVLILNSSGVTLTALPFNLLPGSATQFPVPTGLPAIFGSAILTHDGPPGAILGGIYMAQSGGTGGANFRWPFLAIRSYGSTDGR